MVIVEVRPAGGNRVPVHERVTLITGASLEEQEALVSLIDRVLRGESGGGEVVVEINGRREVLGTGEGDEVSLLGRPVVFDLSHIGTRSESATDAPNAIERAAAAIAAAESAVDDSRSALESAENAHRDALSTLEDAKAAVPDDASDALREAEARLADAERTVSAARRAVTEAAESNGDKVARDEAARRITELEQRKDALEARRQEILLRLGELGDAPDPEPVERALAGLDRLREVKPKPSAAAAELADEWAQIQRQLEALPAPPPPPEWLAGPALTALNEAREALARAESGAPSVEVDRDAIAALERAHREVVEAEQRATERPSRGNKKRLAQAKAAEAEALVRVGVASYGDYLRDIAPGFEESSREERIARARAALNDAETVWKELHGGDVSDGWTALKQREGQVREEAIALLGEAVSDEVLEQRLRSHLESVVDTSWAEQALATALEEARVPIGDHGLQATAEAWLPGAREKFDARRRIEEELAEVDRETTHVQSELAEHQGEAFFAVEQPEPTSTPNAESLERTLKDAEEAHRRAKSAVDAMRADIDSRREATARVAELESSAAERDRARAEARTRLDEAEAALEAARRAAETAKQEAEQATTAMGNGVASIEAEMQLVMLAAAARAAGGGPLVMVGPVPSAPLGPRLLALAARAAEGGLQVVVAGAGKEEEAWAKRRKDVRVVRP